MLMNLMYHHLNSDCCSNDAEMFRQHLAHIREHYRSVFPGESPGKNAVCLTFDDAYADFYYLVFPLLKSFGLKAVLGVPTSVILEKTEEPPEVRMGFRHDDHFANYRYGTFCTFEEMREMSDSGLVRFASHSHNHVVLTDLGVDLDQELWESKAILERALELKIDSFVFPFGRYDEDLLKTVRTGYRYAFRIGNAIHNDFSGIGGVNYRVNGDDLTAPDSVFRFRKRLGFRTKALVKRALAA